MTMSPDTARGVILTGLLVAGGAAEIHALSTSAILNGGPGAAGNATAREQQLAQEQQQAPSLIAPLIGTALLGVFLYAIAAGSPEVAAGFAITAAITSVLLNGTSLFRALGVNGSGTPSVALIPGKYGVSEVIAGSL